ncbi:MAG: CoA-binding protein [Deltaproteobacteria bacterium]|nr:CoA-binding protein [Deltaproteobacteria bacterium]
MPDYTPSDLARFFKPKSIAIVGVSRSASSFGGLSFLHHFVAAGYPGTVYPINPRAASVQGIRAYPDLASLPEVPDLVMVAVQASAVPAVLEECGRLGIRHIHILSAGFGELGTEEGATLEKRVSSIAAQYGLLIMGPNCMGPYCPAFKLTAWGAIPGRDGDLGIISQSGGITQRLTEQVSSLGVGVSKAASIGNATVLDSTDFLEYMAGDDDIDVIAMYLESVRDGRRLFELARDATPRKPIILLKGGRTEKGAATVASHTGTLAGNGRLWQAFFDQAGVTPVSCMNEWADTILAFSSLPETEGGGLFIIGGGGGNSVIFSDGAVGEGLAVPPLSSASMRRIRPIVPVAGSIAGNPLDLWESFVNGDRLCDLLDTAYRDPNIHMVIADRLIPRIAFHSAEMPDPTPGIIDFIHTHKKRKPTVFTIDYDGGDHELNARGTALRRRFCEAGIPAYPSFERAIRALSHFRRYHDQQRKISGRIKLS